MRAATLALAGVLMFGPLVYFGLSFTSGPASATLPLDAEGAPAVGPDFHWIIRHGLVADGSGGDPAPADVGIRDGVIVALGDLEGMTGARQLDARGLVIAPGFIDLHAHADAEVLEGPEAANYLQMGVTTIVTGNCGGSMLDLGEHFAKVEDLRPSVNYGSFIGHGTVRAKVMGLARRPPSSGELLAMAELVRAAMRHGAFGLSTGLIYVPGTYAETDELIELARVAASEGGIYASHIRNEGRDLLSATEEALRIGRAAGCGVQISHLKASGKPSWGGTAALLDRLDSARAEGVRVFGDQYAYTASSTGLDILFPSKDLEGGRGRFLARLQREPALRKEVEDHIKNGIVEAGFEDLSYCRIAHAPGNESLSGLTLKEAAKERLGRDDREAQVRTAIELMVEARGARVGMVYHKMCEEDVERVMRSPHVAVAADAGIRLAGTGKPHPRGAGNNARVLGHYVRERKVLPLGLAVRKMTALPAESLGLRDRGRIAVGQAADLVMFAPETVRDRATYDDPFAAPEGIPHVFVNGVPVIENGVHTGARPGKVLRHRRPQGAPR